MTEEFAIRYIPDRMQELGHENNYLTPKQRHLSLYAGEVRTIDAYNEYFYLVQADSGLTVSSEFGSYDLSDDRINEQQYEHQGKISITNKTKSIRQIIFIQVIPKNI